MPKVIAESPEQVRLLRLAGGDASSLGGQRLDLQFVYGDNGDCFAYGVKHFQPAARFLK